MNINTDINLELMADHFRAQKGLNNNEAIRIKSILQKENILTIYLPLSPDFSGMAVKIGTAETVKRFILVNSNHTIGRQHFTICHELYHLYFQKEFTSARSNSGKFDTKGDPEEFNADVFASFLLLPTKGVLQLIPEPERLKNKITLKTVLAIEHYYSCSRNALLMRLKRMNFIDESLYSKYSVDKIKNAILYGYNPDLYQSGNKGVIIGDYGTLARELFDKGVVSESAYFSLLEDLGFDLNELENKADNE